MKIRCQAYNTPITVPVTWEDIINLYLLLLVYKEELQSTKSLIVLMEDKDFTEVKILSSYKRSQNKVVGPAWACRCTRDEGMSNK